MAEYNDSSISQLLGADRIRKRPASMLGDNGLDGARHGFTEIYGNALDEATSGYGNRLDVCYYENGAVSLRDYGRGVPLGWNESQNNWNWHIIYNELYGGGKYDNGQWYLRSIGTWSEWEENAIRNELLKNFNVDVLTLPDDGAERSMNDMLIKRKDGKVYLKVNGVSWDSVTWNSLNKRLNYLASVGLNGLGAASTQYTSEFFTVKSYRDGVCTEMNFRHGNPVFNDEEVNVFVGEHDLQQLAPKTYETDEPNGTFIYWKPDSTVFTNVDIGSDWLYTTCQDIAHVAGVVLNFEDKVTGKTETIQPGDIQTLVEGKYKNSLTLDENTDEGKFYKTSIFTHGNTIVEGKPFVYVCRGDVAIYLTDKQTPILGYHNSVMMKGGAQHSGVNRAVEDFFTKIARQRGVKIEEKDYEDLLGVCVSSYSNYASFRNQTKDEVQDPFIAEMVHKAVLDKLTLEYSKGDRALHECAEKAIKNAEDRIALKTYAKMQKEANKVKRLKPPEKFVTCKEYEKKNYTRTELWITEGDSAKGSVKEARDKDYQAIFPIRGKILNVLKASIERILANAEIKNIFALLGTGMDLNIDGVNTFDLSKLRFDKIIFATDADEDGFQIRVLLFLVFYKLAPELLQTGHVYIAETPLFMLKFGNGKTLYAYSNAERDKIIKENLAWGSPKVSRFKGLGEVNPTILRETTVAPEHRRLVRVSCDFTNETERDFIDAMYGADKLGIRKAILTEILGGTVADIMEENKTILASIEASDIEEEVEIEEV